MANFDLKSSARGTGLLMAVFARDLSFSGVLQVARGSYYRALAMNGIPSIRNGVFSTVYCSSLLAMVYL